MRSTSQRKVSVEITSVMTKFSKSRNVNLKDNYYSIWFSLLNENDISFPMQRSKKINVSRRKYWEDTDYCIFQKLWIALKWMKHFLLSLLWPSWKEATYSTAVALHCTFMDTEDTDILTPAIETDLWKKENTANILELCFTFSHVWVLKKKEKAQEGLEKSPVSGKEDACGIWPQPGSCLALNSALFETKSDANSTELSSTLWHLKWF